jgi:hypothetical protein
MDSIFDKLTPILHRYQEIEETMARPEVAADFERVRQLAKERASLEELVGIAQQHQKLAQEQDDLKALIEEGGDQDLAQMAREELGAVEQRLGELAHSLRLALLPKDPNDERDVIVEVRSGAGGQEASLFAGDLFDSSHFVRLGRTVAYQRKFDPLRADNEDAAVRLVDDVMPMLWEALPDLRVEVVGANPTARVRELHGPRVDVVGFVPDPYERLSRARVHVHPLRLGAGIKLKDILAMTAGGGSCTEKSGAA